MSIDDWIEYAEAPPMDDLPYFPSICKNGKPRRHFDQYFSGQMVISEDGKLMDRCTDVDAEAFYKRFLKSDQW